MIGSGWISVAASLAVTLALLALSVRLLRRMQAFPGSGAKGVPLRILKRVAVGPKQSVALLRVADRVLLISVADGGSRLLTELTEEEAGRVLEGEGTETGPAPPVKRPGPAPPVKLPRLKLLGRVVLVWALLAPLAIPLATPARGAPDPSPASAVAGATTTGASVQAPRSESGWLRAGSSGNGGRAEIQLPVIPRVEVSVGEGRDALHLSGTVGLVVLIGLMTLLPALFLLMTSFTRILIVLQFLRPAVGTQTTPPTQLLVALAVLLTGVVMNPVLQETNSVAVQPFLKGQITQADAYRLGVRPFREFMLNNTREKDLAVFTELTGAVEAESIDDVPTVTLVSAFVTSELRTAFQMGFMLFLPFVVLDLVIASVLMSLGMFMLPPMMVSLPFKLLLFVLADGWTLVVQNLVRSFQ